MANVIIPEHDELVYDKHARPNWYYSFGNKFTYKNIREGVFVLATRTKDECERFRKMYSCECGITGFEVHLIKGKRFDQNNKIVCDGDVNVIDISDGISSVVFGRKSRCLFTLLAPVGQKLTYDQNICEFNCNVDEIDEYIRNQQLEQYKEEIRAAELKKALKQIARQQLIDEGILFDEEHKRPYISREVVGYVWMRDGGRCRECGSTKDLQIDHIIPFSKGGSSEPENLQLLCKDCNLKKGNRI